MACPKRQSSTRVMMMVVSFLSCSFLSNAQAAVGIMKALNIYGGQLYPTFSPSTFNYELDLDDEGVLQHHKDFATLAERVVLPPTGGHSPSVILAPHLNLHEYKDQRPKLFVDGREVPCEATEQASPHVAISRKELLKASFQFEGGRHAYSLILIEVHMPSQQANVTAAAVIDEGMHILRYIIRVHNTVPRVIAAEAARRQLLVANPAQPMGWGAQQNVVQEVDAPQSAPAGFAEVMVQSSIIGIKLSDGFCVRTTGPVGGVPMVSASAKALDLYKESSPHIVCFGHPDTAEADDDEAERFKFVASRFGAATTGAALGQFGFGPNSKVALRPEIATDAIWPLQEGVQSLGVPLDGSTFRVIGVRAQSEGGEQIDLPMVMTRLRRKDWPVDVQFMNSSIGSCHPQPGPDHLYRYVCRTEEDIPANTPAQFVAFCASCRSEGAKQPLTMRVNAAGGGHSIDGRMTSANLQVASSRTAHSVEKPWAAWQAEVPIDGSQRQWAITVQPSGDERQLREEGVIVDGKMDAPMVFEVLLVGASTTLAFESVTLTSEQKDKLVFAGTAMSQTSLVIMTLLSCAALATFVLGLPNRLLAALPALSAAMLSLQFLALVGNLPTSPEPLRALAGPLMWIASGTPKSTLVTALLTMAAVGVVHGLAVCRFIISNGRGSANALPHGFSLGGWELRALGLLAFPIAASTATYLVPLLVSSQKSGWWFFVMIPPGFILLVLSLLAFWTWRSVTTAISDDQVVLITLPPAVGSGQETGYPIFADHFCDQLRAIPSEAGKSNLLGDWLASPGWCFKPEVASIHLVEHRGARLFKPSMFQWCSRYDAGPWRAHQLRQQMDDEQAQDPSIVRMPSDYTLFKLGIKKAPTATSAEAVYREVNAEVDAMRGHGSMATSQAPLWGNTTTSELVVEHPISVKTNFAYQGSSMAGGSVAGVRCLSWINCAVPAATLVKLESHLQGEVALRTQAGQMSGPVAGGRLAACFDWGVLWPWNWSADVALKIVLGIWAALLPHADELSSTYSSVINGVTLGATIAYVWAAIVFRPYVHLFDVLSTVCARFAVALIVGACLLVSGPPGAWGSFVPAMMTVAALTLVPLCVLLVAACILAKMMTGDVACRGCSQGNKAAEELLEKYWQEGHKGNEILTTVDISKHCIDVVFQDMHPAPRLPALVRNPVEHLRLQPCPGRRGASTQLPSSGKPWLSLVPSLLFPLAGQRKSTARTAAPIAALTELPDDGRLLFADRASNGGLDWREVLHSFIDPIDEDCAGEAERLIQAYEFPLDGASAEPSLVIIELVPPDTTPSNLIR